MIEVDFGTHGGGKLAFKTPGKVLDYLDQQMAAWSDDAAFQEQVAKPGGNHANEVRAFAGRWTTLRNTFSSAIGQSPNDHDALAERFKASLRNVFPVSRDDPAGQAVAELVGNGDLHGAFGAVRMFKAQPTEQLFSNMPKVEVEGALTLWARVNGMDSRTASETRARLRKLISDIREANLDRQKEAEAIEDQALDRRQEMLAQLANERVAFAEFRADTERGIAEDRERWEKDWLEKLDLYTEQLKLRAAVKQWSDRADAHESSFVRQRRWIIGVGVSGFVLAWGWALAALSLAKWFFSDALADGAGKLPSGTLRPTWSHELIFAGAASLLYLTLFLWSMRILVRMMMSEHHLGIDARSRASMAHTYLALIEDNGAASDADRAIVLSALFRPVTDGLVKDDALPMISPATFLSGGLAGKS
jgi:hypothetical protein